MKFFLEFGNKGSTSQNSAENNSHRREASAYYRHYRILDYFARKKYYRYESQRRYRKRVNYYAVPLMKRDSGVDSHNQRRHRQNDRKSQIPNPVVDIVGDLIFK